MNIIEEQEQNIKLLKEQIKWISISMQRNQEINIELAKLYKKTIKSLKKELKDEQERLIRVKNWASYSGRPGDRLKKEGNITGTSDKNNAGTKPKIVGPAQEEIDTNSSKNEQWEEPNGDKLS